ncbi:hypothetical protein [Thiothrix lacustris]|uniref:hypothetical protein n=1 Tax=Thiothrix lacustris TaxID=525917 RepID=UPI000AD08809|nr:hypothetical protein [Thiothrix lacustris]
MLYELEYGICRSQHQQRNRDNLNNFLKYIQVLDWGRRAMVAKVQRNYSSYQEFRAAIVPELQSALVLLIV